MTRRPDQDELGISVVSQKAVYSANHIRRIYDQVLGTCSTLNVPPTEAGIQGEEKLRSFDRVRSRVESAIAEGNGWSLRHVHPERKHANWAFWDYTASADVGTLVGARAKKYWYAALTVFPQDAGTTQEAIIPELIQFARLTMQQYGYICHYRRSDAPAMTSIAMGAWMAFFDIHTKVAILRDIYPVNFLGRDYLELPIGSATFRQWIEHGSYRGRFEPLNSDVMMWQPPAERIPELREILFREGLILYAGFFDPSSPWHRDLSKPYRPPRAPTPDELRAETYKGQDPCLSPTTI
jgi:hypothetical protein